MGGPVARATVLFVCVMMIALAGTAPGTESDRVGDDSREADEFARFPEERAAGSAPRRLDAVPASAGSSGRRCIRVRPRDNIQRMLNRRREGARFCFLPRTYKLSQPLKPRNRQKLIGYRGDRGRTILDGGGTSSAAIVAGGRRVRVMNFTVQRFDNPAQKGAIDSRGGGAGWRIRNNVVRRNRGVGICVSKNARVIANRVIRNGQLGLCGAGVGILIARNKIAFNNTDGHNPGWEAGGTKFVYTRGLVVRRNHVHDNKGPGLWTDVNNIHTTFAGNLVVNNTHAGIFHEVSYDAVIRNNVVRRNGLKGGYWRDAAGILVSNSRNVEVYGNVLRNNGMGIAAVQVERNVPEQRGPHEVANLYVHDNRIRQVDTKCTWEHKPFGRCQGYTGLYVGGMSSTPYYTTKNNRFEKNTYILERPRSFWWDGDWQKFREWRRAHGQDRNGKVSFVRTNR